MLESGATAGLLRHRPGELQHVPGFPGREARREHRRCDACAPHGPGRRHGFDHGPARTPGIPVVEDAAQAHGAEHAGRRVGSFGIGSFSFYATKNVSTGEGGAVTTDDDEVADRLRLLRNQGMRERYVYEIAGHNYRMTELQAAVGIPQLERLEQINRTRRSNAAHLNEALADVLGIEVPRVAEGSTSVWHQYTIRVTGDSAVDRDGMVAGLEEAGVGCGIYYPRVAYDYDCYRSNPAVVVEPRPEAERPRREVVSLPVHPYPRNRTSRRSRGLCGASRPPEAGR
ncbi:MAG: DegT/DnrJ/EryC1/StrS family aminotransferase [Microthrixaceae bacterium]